MNKDSLPPGPWHDEPNEVYFEHLGYKCLILRHDDFGSLNGYVVIPEDHPWRDASREELDGIAVHGGLTYVGRWVNDASAYVVGFDCCHCYDVVPKFLSMREIRFGVKDGTYKDITYVTEQCKRLAEQAQEAAQAKPGRVIVLPD